MINENILNTHIDSLLETVRDLRYNLVNLKIELKRQGFIVRKKGRIERKTKSKDYKCGCWNFSRCSSCYNLGMYRWRRNIKDEIYIKFARYREERKAQAI